MPTFRDILLQVTGDASDAEATLAEVSAQLDVLARKSVDVEVKLTGLAEVDAEIAALETKLAALGTREIKIPVKIDRNSFQNELREMAAEAAETIGRARGRGGGAPNVPNAPNAPDLGPGLDDASRRTDEFVQTIDRGRQGVVGFGFNIAGLTNALLALGIAILVTTAPALAALAASLGGAAAAVGGLAVALGGILGPVGLVAVGVFTGLAKAIQAVIAIRQERSLAQTAQGQQDAANATLQHTRAVQSLATAQRDAAREIRNARHDNEIAQRSLGDASRSVREQMVAAYRAWQDAVEGVADALRGLEHAQLNVQRAKLDHDEAVLALRDLRKELGLTGSEFDKLFNQITDVRLDPAKVKALIPQVDALGLDQRRALELKNAILDVADSNLRQKDAVNAVGDATRGYNRAQQDRNKFAQQGILAFGPLRSAVEGLADAQWAAAHATEHFNDVMKLGVAGAPSVVAARDAIRSSNQQIAASADKAKAALESVPKSMRPLVAAFDELATAFNKAMVGPKRAATDVLVSLSEGLTRLLGSLAPQIEELSAQMTDAFGSLFDGLTGARATGFFKEMFAAAGPVILDLERGIENLLGFFSNIAEAAMPALQTAADAIANTIGRWDENTRKGTTGFERMTEIFNDGVVALGKWLSLVGALSKLVLDFFGVTNDQSNGMLDSLTKTVNKWDEWVTNADNAKAISDAIETAREALGFVFSLLGKIIELLIAIGPTARDLFGGIAILLGEWLNLMTSIFNLVNKLPAPLRTFGGVLAGLLTAGGVIAAWKLAMFGIEQSLGRVISRVRDLARARGGILGRLFGGGGAGGAGEGVVAGGRAAGAEIAEAMVAAGRIVAAEIAAAMRGGGLPFPGGGRTPPPEAPLPPGTILGPDGKPLPPSGGQAPAQTGIRGFLNRAGGGRGALRGAIRLGVWTDVAIGLGRGIVKSFQEGINEGAKTALNSITFGGSDKIAQWLGIPSDKEIEEQEAKSEEVYKAALIRGRRNTITTVAGVSSRISADVSNQTLNQLKIAFRNLGERSTGSLSTLRKNFSAVMRQIGEDIPRDTVSWNKATGKAVAEMMRGIARNVAQGRIPVREGFDAILNSMRSRSLRGRDAVVGAFKEAAAGIERWMRRGKISAETYSDQIDRLTRTLFRRLHVRVTEFSSSYRKAFADLVQGGVDAANALDILRTSKRFGSSEGAATDPGRTTQELFPTRPGRGDTPPPGEAPDKSLLDYWRKRGFRWDPRRRIWRHMMLGGVLPGYGGGDKFPTMLEAGEGVLRKEVVARLGAATINALNAGYPTVASATGGFANGGIMDWGGGRGGDQHFHIPPAAPANPQPDPRITAAQLSLYMRAEGMRLSA